MGHWQASTEFWFGWSLSDRLALASLVATIFIPCMLHRVAKKADQVAAEASDHLQGIQEELLQISDELLRVSARTRRDELLTQLKEVEDPQVFEALRTEAERYEGADLRMLRSVYRQNPLHSLPYCEELTSADVDDYVRSLPRRLNTRNRGWGPWRDVNDFVRLAASVQAGKESDIAVVLYEATREAPLPHDFFREIVAKGSWRMAAPLVYKVANDWNWTKGARGTNLLTGVFVGLIDIDRRPGGRGYELSREYVGQLLSREDDAQLQEDMRQALASLLHLGPLTGISHLGRDALEMKGSTEPLSAMVAWMIRAAGNAVQQDAHLEMRIMESLTSVVDSLKRIPNWGGWGIDDEDVQRGMLRIRHKCPTLWTQYGPKLLRATGVPLHPIIPFKLESSPTRVAIQDCRV